MALAGTDVEQPGACSVEFLLSSASATASPTTMDFLAMYRVTAEDGLELRAAPSDQGSVVGRRKRGDVVRVAERRDGWMRLAPSEKAVIRELQGSCGG